MPEKTTTAAKKLTKNHVILIVALAVVICAAVIVAILLLKSTPAKASGAKVIDKNNLATIQEDIKDKVAEGMFATHMNTNWVFPEGKEASSNAIMGNSASNNYPFWFTVTLADTQEVVFTSSVLPLGSQIDKIVLKRIWIKGPIPLS